MRWATHTKLITIMMSGDIGTFKPIIKFSDIRLKKEKKINLAIRSTLARHLIVSETPHIFEKLSQVWAPLVLVRTIKIMTLLLARTASQDPRR